MIDMKNSAAEFAAWRNSPEGKAAAATADGMTKQEKICRIIEILMELSGESADAIEAQKQKIMNG